MATPRGESFAPQQVLAAMATMRGGQVAAKKLAVDYLGRFQKSKDAWTTTISILQSSPEPEAQLFAATTLKGKITYDVSTQIPADQLPSLRDQLLVLLKKFAAGPKPVRVQLCVCLAILAIQMTHWKDVLPMVVSTLGNEVESHAAILDFLRVLPEEVTEGRKISLSEEELTERTTELLSDNTDQVVQLLASYASSSPAAAENPQLMECITSWLREIPVRMIVASPLLNVIVNALGNDTALESAAETLGTICRETREVDDNLEAIQTLLPRIVALRPRIKAVVQEEDIESFKAFTRLFADAGDAWVVAIVREPITFRPLVETLLECAALDKERDAIRYTFNFWYELKQYLVLERYVEARMQYFDIYSRLVDIMLKHLEYPQSDGPESSDLFDGDREAEEKFREFRHQMGDTLKDACEVMGVADCLMKVLNAIQGWMSNYASRATATLVPHWQELEAPLFAMRAMGRMIDNHENVVLPQLMPLLVQMPKHEKLRFATIMALGRYTEWTAEHPEYLGPQFKYLVSSFETDSLEITRASAQSFKYFCTDCRKLLKDQVVEMHQFYDSILDKLPEMSQEEVTEGVASIIGLQQPQDVYKLLKLYVDPVMTRLMAKANQAIDNPGKLALADQLQLIIIFVENVTPPFRPGEEDPAVKYWAEVFPVLAKILDNFIDSEPICERICKTWRAMVISYRSAMTPLLPQMANKLAAGFAESKQGAFLWVTGAILREFSEDREHVTDRTSDDIYSFFENQATNALRLMSDASPVEIPNVIEDFFRLLTDALLYYPHKLIPSPIFTPIFQAAISVLALEQTNPLSATLHYLRDLLTYGGSNPASSMVQDAQHQQEYRTIIRRLLSTHGEALVRQVMAGMMITFPRDCFADGSGVLLGMFELLPQQTTAWVEGTIRVLPEGTVSGVEVNRLMVKIKEKLQDGTGLNGGLRQVRVLLQDFTNTYRRRYVAPRDGLGELEGKRFHFSG